MGELDGLEGIEVAFEGEQEGLGALESSVGILEGVLDALEELVIAGIEEGSVLEGLLCGGFGLLLPREEGGAKVCGECLEELKESAVLLGLEGLEGAEVLELLLGELELALGVEGEGLEGKAESLGSAEELEELAEGKEVLL